MSVIARTYRPLPSYVPPLDQAMSGAAKTLRAVLTGKVYTPSNSWTEGRTERGKSTVLEAVREARSRGISVSSLAINVASALIWAFPEHVPPAEVKVEEDGEIVFDWNESSERGLTVTVTANGYLGYSALVGLKPDYGRAPFAGSIPDTVLFNLLRVYPPPAQTRRR